MMKKILVACGTGMSTSTMIAQKLQDFLAEQGIAATTALNDCQINAARRRQNRFHVGNFQVTHFHSLTQRIYRMSYRCG